MHSNCRQRPAAVFKPQIAARTFVVKELLRPKNLTKKHSVVNGMSQKFAVFKTFYRMFTKAKASSAGRNLDIFVIPRSARRGIPKLRDTIKIPSSVWGFAIPRCDSE